MLSTGIVVHGKAINKIGLGNLLDLPKTSDLHSLQKLTPHHVYMQGICKQKVKLRGTKYKDLSEFISLTNDWFNIFDSTTMNPNGSACKAAYGVHLKETRDIRKNEENDRKCLARKIGN